MAAISGNRAALSQACIETIDASFCRRICVDDLRCSRSLDIFWQGKVTNVGFCASSNRSSRSQNRCAIACSTPPGARLGCRVGCSKFGYRNLPGPIFQLPTRRRARVGSSYPNTFSASQCRYAFLETRICVAVSSTRTPSSLPRNATNASVSSVANTPLICRLPSAGVVITIGFCA